MIDRRALHEKKVAQLQEQMHSHLLHKKSSTFSLHYQKGHSNTTRSKSYKNQSSKIDFSSLNKVVHIDPHKKIAVVEPRVTMETLVKATLPFGLTVPVIPEFKGITVGGAIMGGAAESASHKWGTFNDLCTAYELLCGNGSILRVSPTEHADLFYGISGSYGTIAALTLAELQLIPADKFVHLHIQVYHDPLKALAALQDKLHASSSPHFLDGMIFSKNSAVVIEGRMVSKPHQNISTLSLNSPFAKWYYQHVENKVVREKEFDEWMPLEDYLFRYDRGAFWMGAYLFNLPFLARFITQGVFPLSKPENSWFSEQEVSRMHQICPPNGWGRSLFCPLLSSQRLWGMLHKAEKWVQDRLVIQDFCIPETKAMPFLEEVLTQPGVFPMWLCPIKGTNQPQIFAPHLLEKESSESHFMNVGIYGMANYAAPMKEVTQRLEDKTSAYGGRKVLYSRSYYTPEQFWQKYSLPDYRALRKKAGADGIWPEITDKVLSE